ncbi:MAG: hypothetical protein IPK16_25870 [Anaerolineales bacterium]|nr:hypothetical protein [Anaerolineales bacterium]
MTNTNPYRALPLTSIEDELSSGETPAVNCAVLEVAAGKALKCTYGTAVGGAAPGTNTAWVTSFTGIVYPTAVVAYDFTAAAVKDVLANVNVDDTQPSSTAPWAFAGNGVREYTYQVTCDQDEFGSNDSYEIPVENTATIRETAQTDSASAAVTCWKLDVSKDAAPTFTRTYQWQIEKSVTPAVVDLFDGEQAETNYTVAVAQTGAVDSGWAVSGNIKVVNPAPIPATLAAVSDQLSDGVNVPVNCSSLAVPANGGQVTCTYATALPDAATRTNTATVQQQINDAVVKGYQAVAQVVFGAPTVEVDKSISVQDSYEGGAPVLLQSGITTAWETTYAHTVDCNAAQQYVNGKASLTRDNTAEIVETGADASAHVDINCYRLLVEKTAQPGYTQTSTWDIDKRVEPAMQYLFEGESAPITYTVRVTKTGVIASEWGVAGAITVKNPAPMVATLESLDDVFDGKTFSCLNAPSPVAAAVNGEPGVLACNYAFALDGEVNGDNVATARQILSSGSRQDYSGMAPVDFAQASVTQVNASVNIWDVLNGGPPTLVGENVSADFAIEIPDVFNCTSALDYGSDGVARLVSGNEASIAETEQRDDATAAANCYRPLVSKTADPAYTRTYRWAIDKLVTPAQQDLFEGDTTTLHYTVRVTRELASTGDYWVDGAILVTNTNPYRALPLTSIEDELSSGETPAVNCAVLEVAAGKALKCTYGTAVAGRRRGRIRPG